MKPVLVSEAELEALYDEENKGRCCVVREDFLAGARAAVEKVGVNAVVESDEGELRFGCEPGEHLAWLHAGDTILVRCKEPEHE